jgi:glycosyltransferase involved in cell wall biosynthesis
MPEILKILPDSTLDIYGADPDGYKSVLAREIQSLGLKQRVFLKGTTDNPEKILSDADVALMPSESEGFAIAVTEALSMGVPVVASDIPIHKEILENGAWGILTPVHDSSELAKAVIRLSTDTVEYSRLSNLATERAGFFGKEKMITGYINLYRSLMGTKQKDE